MDVDGASRHVGPGGGWSRCQRTDARTRSAGSPTWARFSDYGAGRVPRFLPELTERQQS